MKKRFLFVFILLLLLGFFVFRILTVVRPFQRWQPDWLSPQGEEADSSSKAELSFALIGDPENQLDNLEKALEKINSLGLEFVVIVGDLTSTGTDKEFKEIDRVLDKAEINYYLIPGNHDLWYEKKEKANLWQQYFGQKYYARETGEYHLLFLDNSDEWQGFSQPELDWLGHYLFETEDFQSGKLEKKYLVFTHIPFWHPESKKAMGEYSQQMKDQAYEILQKFCQSPPLAVFSGHLHKTGDYNYGCSNGKQIRMINVGSIHETRNLQLPRFLQVKVLENGQISIKEIELDS